MKYLHGIEPRFKHIWGTPIVAMLDGPIAPFPGKRKNRWMIARQKRAGGVFVPMYEGKPSKQAIQHAIQMSIDGERMYLIEFDKRRAYCQVTFEQYAGSIIPVVYNGSLWTKYHKMDIGTYYQAWRRKPRGVSRRKAPAIYDLYR